MPRRVNKSKGSNAAGTEPAVVRCAIYTRKSTSEGLDQAFNSLDAQREACEAYIASQKHQNWEALSDRYDDGGFSGGTIDRPAITQLMADIEAGKVNCVVVYKVDRLSRSLLDFARIMQLFEQKGIHFVSVTQHFNTADSMGRLTLNILLSFAQFEREIISERTRDKIAAARRKGKWAGGRPILGYNLVPGQHKLVINPIEAEQVRMIFQTYIGTESLIRAASDITRRDWTTKRWVARNGMTIGGKPYTKTNLHKLLTNVAYLGKVRHRDEIFEGEHEAIVDEALWKRAHALLERNYRSAGAVQRNRFGSLLKGMLRCRGCNAAMIQMATRRGNRVYRYYACTRAQKLGYAQCATGTVQAGALDQAVLERLRGLPFDRRRLKAGELAETMPLLDGRLQSLRPEDQAQLVRRLVQAVDFDGASKSIGLTLTDEAAACIMKTATA